MLFCLYVRGNGRQGVTKLLESEGLSEILWRRDWEIKNKKKHGNAHFYFTCEGGGRILRVLIPEETHHYSSDIEERIIKSVAQKNTQHFDAFV